MEHEKTSIHRCQEHREHAQVNVKQRWCNWARLHEVWLTTPNASQRHVITNPYQTAKFQPIRFFGLFPYPWSLRATPLKFGPCAPYGLQLGTTAQILTLSFGSNAVRSKKESLPMQILGVYMFRKEKWDINKESHLPNVTNRNYWISEAITRSGYHKQLAKKVMRKDQLDNVASFADMIESSNQLAES